MPRCSVLLLPALAVLATCAAPAYVNAPVGRYDELAVAVERTGGRSYLVLDRPACVAFLSVSATYEGTTSWNRFDYGPVLGPFSARFPLYAQVPRCFEAGRHRFPLHNTVVSPIPPPTCLRGDVPALDGCHPPGYENASRHHDPTRGLGPAEARIVLASDRPIDPYAVAYAMSVAVLDDSALQERLATALLEAHFSAVAALVQELVADVPGSPLWSGIVRMRDPG